MALLGLDTRGWNLSAGLVTATMVGCGPTVILGDTDGIDDPTEGTDDSNDDVADDAPTTTTPPPPSCVTNDDCPAGFFCDAGVCAEDYNYDDYCDDGCCDGGCCYDDCYYEGPYYGDCYSDEDCPSASLCNNDYGYGYCDSLPVIEDCGDDGAPELLPLPFDVPGTSDIISLRFVETDGIVGDELVIMRADGAEVIRSGQAGVPLPAPADTVVVDVADGDFNGDGVLDLAAALSPSGVGIFLGDGAGGFTIVEANVYAVDSVAQIRALDFNGDGALDAAIATAPLGGSALLLGAGDGTFTGLTAHAETPVRNLLATDIVGPGYSDVVVSTDGAVTVYVGNAGAAVDADLLLDDDEHPAALALAADPGGNGNNAVLSLTEITDWTAARAYYQGGLTSLALLSAVGSVGDTGDISGDGGDDFLILSGASLTYLSGSSDTVIGCTQSYPLQGSYQLIAVGDLDGDGRAEIAFAAGAAVSLYGTL